MTPSFMGTGLSLALLFLTNSSQPGTHQPLVSPVEAFPIPGEECLAPNMASPAEVLGISFFWD